MKLRDWWWDKKNKKWYFMWDTFDEKWSWFYELEINQLGW